MSLSKDQITAVKGRGFLMNRGTECFSGRVVTVAGRLTPHELCAIAECAEKYGTGTVVFTSRLSAEIVGIPYDRIPEAEAFMAERGLSFGGTGAKIRPITACKGTTCVFGNIDTQGMAQLLHERFYVGYRSIKLPHKFKIGIGGCPNSCMKPSLNDVGVEGCHEVRIDTSVCRSCGRCSVADGCPSHAAQREGGMPTIDKKRCTGCGVCLTKCPFGAAVSGGARCRIYVGGTWGKIRRDGTPLSRLFKPEEVPDIIERVMLWYKENGYAKERLGAAIDRLGIEALESAIATDSLTARREEILALPIKER